MRKIISSVAIVMYATLFIVACSKASKESANNVIPQDILNRIAAQGLSTEGVQVVNGGYLIEGDIIMSKDDLFSVPGGPNMTIANEEQYRTFNLVTGLSRTITVSLNTAAQYFVDATNEAINRYNAENLGLHFQLVSGTSADINIVTYYAVSSTIGSSGFPTSSGDPYNKINLNTYYFTASASKDYLGTIIAHEMGHCIGFRHTDYMNRRYSCGSGGNEGQAKNGVGAVLIPGTPSGPDAGSWMLACIGNGVNRPFNANDKVALNYLY